MINPSATTLISTRPGVQKDSLTSVSLVAESSVSLADELSDKAIPVPASLISGRGDHTKSSNVGQVIANNRILTRYQRSAWAYFHENQIAILHQPAHRRFDDFFRRDGKPAQAPLGNGGDPARAFVRREPNQKRRMPARPLLGKEQNPGGCRFENGQRRFALQIHL